MSYTKGPWVIDFGGSIGHIKSVPENQIEHKTPTPTIVRYDINYAHICISESEQAANAKLIAAAPELLEALDKLLVVVTKQNNLGAKWHESVFGEMMQALSDSAEAIDKAKGVENE